MMTFEELVKAKTNGTKCIVRKHTPPTPMPGQHYSISKADQPPLNTPFTIIHTSPSKTKLDELVIQCYISNVCKICYAYSSVVELFECKYCGHTDLNNNTCNNCGSEQ